MVDLLAPYGPSPALASLKLALAVLFRRTGRYEELLAAVEQGAEIARALGDERLLASLEERRSTALSLLGENERAKQAFEAVIPLLEAAGRARQTAGGADDTLEKSTGWRATSRRPGTITREL